MSLHLSCLVFLFAVATHAEAYDWVRSNVNEFWYNQFVGKCQDNFTGADALSAINNSSCHNSAQALRVAPNFGKDLVTDLYFDEALVEQAKQNQCKFNYWSALNTKNGDAYGVQAQANKKLSSQFNVGDSLKSHSFFNRSHIFSDKTDPQSTAVNAQKTIVDQLVDSAILITEKQRDLKHLQAKYPSGQNREVNEKLILLTQEIEVMESSFMFAEDPAVAAFVKYNMINKVNDSYSAGKTPDKDELKKFFLNDKKEGFQTQVVDKKLKTISDEQQEFADIDGKYSDSYKFKVKTVQSGVGAKVLEKRANQTPLLARVQCELDSKYGKGEQVAHTAHTSIVAGVTVMVGGSALLLARLGQLGMVSQKAAQLAQLIALRTGASLGVEEIARGIVESCNPDNFKKKDADICSRVAKLKEQGLELDLEAEKEESECLQFVGLAALSGAAGFKVFVAAKKLKREEQIVNLGLRGNYDSLVSKIKSHPQLLPAERKQLASELERSISLSSHNGFPRKEFLESLAKDDPQDLLTALQQINSDTKAQTFSGKVKNWLSGKKLNKKEADELEACLVGSSSKTTSCSALPKKRDS